MYPIDWDATHENGLRIINSPVNPLNGAYSLLLFSDGTEWDATDIGFRKSASLYLKSPPHNRGFTDGRIRTLIRRNNMTPQTNAWGGIFIVSDRAGIGTRNDPGQNRYEISDQGGFIRIVKFTDALPTVLAISTSTFDPNITYGFQVRWVYDGIADSMLIEASVGTSLTFSDLAPFLSYVDTDSPHHVSSSEGLFAQTLASGDIVSYSFDTTSIYSSSRL